MVTRPLTAQLQVKAPDGSAALPIGANWFHFRLHLGDLEMLVGYVSAGAIEQITPDLMAGRDPQPLEPEVTGRYLVQMNGFLQLRAQVEDIYKKMKEAGVLDGIPDIKNG